MKTGVIIGRFQIDEPHGGHLLSFLKKVKQKKMNIKILKKDGSKGFRYLAGITRPINPSQVTKIAKSVSKERLLTSSYRS